MDLRCVHPLSELPILFLRGGLDAFGRRAHESEQYTAAVLFKYQAKKEWLFSSIG